MLHHRQVSAATIAALSKQTHMLIDKNPLANVSGGQAFLRLHEKTVLDEGTYWMLYPVPTVRLFTQARTVCLRSVQSYSYTWIQDSDEGQAPE